MLRKSFTFPTARGRRSLRDRVEDSILSGITELIAASLYRDVAERLAAPREGFRGGLQRGFDVERDPGVKEMLRDYVAQF